MLKSTNLFWLIEVPLVVFLNIVRSKQQIYLFVLYRFQSICVKSTLSLSTFPGVYEQYFFSPCLLLSCFLLWLLLAQNISVSQKPATSSLALDLISLLSCFEQGVPHVALTRFHWISVAKINSSKIKFLIGLNFLLSILMHFVSSYSTFIVLSC